MLYLDCRADVLLRRFSETRRRHPLAPEGAPEIGIEREIDLLAPVRGHAQVLIDTSELTPHDLRAEIAALVRSDAVGAACGVGPVVFLQARRAARHRHGVRLPVPAQSALGGRLAPAGRARRRCRGACRKRSPVRGVLQQYLGFGDYCCCRPTATRAKPHLSIGFGCTGGQHRSVAMAEKLANTLAKAGWQVSIRHRELERRARSVPPSSVG